MSSRNLRTTSYQLMLVAALLAWDFASPPLAVAIVNTDKPVQEVGNIPPLNVQGTTFPANLSKIDPTNIHEGSFTNGLDLLGPWWLIPNQTDATSGCGAGAQSFPMDGTINEIPFLQHVCSTSHTCFTTHGSATPALSADLKNAIDDANAELKNEKGGGRQPCSTLKANASPKRERPRCCFVAAPTGRDLVFLEVRASCTSIETGQQFSSYFAFSLRSR